MVNSSGASLDESGNGAPAVKLPTTWRINHPEEAGGPTYVRVEPSPTAVATFLRIGVTITPMYDGPLESPVAAPKDPEYSIVLETRVRVAGVMLSTIRGLDHFKDEPHWRRELDNIDKLVKDIASHLRSSSQ